MCVCVCVSYSAKEGRENSSSMMRCATVVVHYASDTHLAGWKYYTHDAAPSSTYVVKRACFWTPI